MTSDRIRVMRLSTAAAVAVILSLSLSAFAQAPSKAVVAQIAAIQQVKQNLTPAQTKMDSVLAFAVAGQKNPAAVSSFATAMPQLPTSPNGRIIVDVYGTVSPALAQAIRNAGGDVLHQSTRFDAVHAVLPLSSIESIAARSDVTRVTKAPRVRANVGSVTSQGYVAHRAKQVVAGAINGAGVNVGILSDSALPAEVTALKASGDLPASSYVLPGQDGPSNGTNEGTAMMEIAYDMAPGSTPIFATAFTSEPQFADNIIALQAAGCKVIADDVTYSDEGVFQDTIIAQAVNQVVANGSSYFSSAANSGSALYGDSQAYEGDFVDGGPVSGVIGSFEGGQGEFHNFGGGQVFNSYRNAASYIILQWSDPYGGACNDYDLFVTDSTGSTIKGFSAARQDCSASSVPDEETPIAGGSAGDRIYVVLYSGVTRALHINGWDGALSIATTGNTYGHNAGKSTISMAATYYGSAHMGVVPFTGMANPVEPFSSDGPRKIFYYPNGTEITPGNVLFATNGGTTLLKPDLTAADGVFTRTPGFLPFFGTSAASPHAAGIAALVVQARPSYTPAQVKKAMTATALDNMAVGPDINGGYGVAMANGAVAYAQSH
jgi:Subtilase family